MEPETIALIIFYIFFVISFTTITIYNVLLKKEISKIQKEIGIQLPKIASNTINLLIFIPIVATIISIVMLWEKLILTI